MPVQVWHQFTLSDDHGSHPHHISTGSSSGGGSPDSGIFVGFAREDDGSASTGGLDPGDHGAAAFNSWRYIGPYLVQAAAFAQATCMPAIRSTIAVLCETGEVKYSVAATLGAVGALQAISSIIGPMIGRAYSSCYS